MDFKRIKRFLNKEVGIELNSEKLEKVYKKKLDSILKSLNISYEEFNRKLLTKDEKLRNELIRKFTVNETYFFREKHQFDTLINYVLPELDKKLDINEVISILCAPVSSGEELYSIAILLLEEGNLIKKRDFFLLGIDIDSDMIKRAKKGIFPKRSLQKLPSEMIKKYFIKKGEYYEAIDELKNAVNFKVVNVLDEKAMMSLGKFDVIFSRNMLIYFDEVHKNQVILTFCKMLKDDGYLFLGHAERVTNNLFKIVKLGDSIVYKKNSNC